MSTYNVDISKMYAHVDFDLDNPQGRLGLAVYSIGKIPGFSGKPSSVVEEHMPGLRNSHELFLNTFSGGQNPVEFTQAEIQSGKIFFLNEIEDKLMDLDLRGKAQAETTDAQVVVNIDDPQLWIGALPRIPEGTNMEEVVEVARKYRDQELSDLGEATAKYTAAIEKARQGLDEESRTEFFVARKQLEAALQRVYIAVSRITNPKTGPKQYPKRTSPPTVIASPKYNIAYYPGYRGAQYMVETPKLENKSVHTHKDEPGKYWHQILVSNVEQEIKPFNLKALEVQVLDYITEILARLFFKAVRKANTTNFKQEDFNRAAIPVASKAHELLGQIDDSDLKEQYQKTASNFIGTWVDLWSGQVYKSLGELLSAKQGQGVELAKAAGVMNEYI